MEILRRTCACAVLAAILASCDQAKNESIGAQTGNTKEKIEKVIAVDFAKLQEIILKDAEEIEEQMRDSIVVTKLIDSAIKTHRQIQENPDPNAKITFISMGNRSFRITPIRIPSGEIILRVDFNLDYSHFSPEEQDVLNNSRLTHEEIFTRIYSETAAKIMKAREDLLRTAA